MQYYMLDNHVILYVKWMQNPKLHMQTEIQMGSKYSKQYLEQILNISN